MNCKHSKPLEGAFALAPSCVFCDLEAARADRDRLTAEVDRLTKLSEVWRKILDAVEDEARRVAICRTCSSNECQIRERCTSATACRRSLYSLAVQSKAYCANASNPTDKP